MIQVRRSQDGRIVLESATKHHLNAEVHLSNRYAHEERYTLVHHRNKFYEWVGTHWAELPLSEVKKRLKADFSQAVVEKLVDDPNNPGQQMIKLVDYSPNKGKYAELLEALELEVGIDPRTDNPVWLGADGTADTSPEALDSARNIVACRNVLLDARTKETYAHTPRLFNLFGVDLDYDPDAAEPVEWLRFLDSLWGHDPQSIDTLQEIMGYLLTPRTEQHKMFLLIGPTRSGKGTITDVITALLGGKANVSPVTMSDLNTDFGMAGLVGKSLATMTDLRFRSKDDGMAVSRLLAITGGDMVGVNQKFKDQLAVHLSTRFLIASNELPQLRDESGAIRGRLLVLKMTESFLHREDHDLGAKLMAERAAIFNWALRGLDRLNERGKFIQPLSAKGELDTLGHLSSPISVFIEDCCEVGPEEETPRKDMFLAWGEWAREHGQFVGSDVAFGRNLRSVVSGLEDVRRGKRGQQVRHYVGVGLSQNGRDFLEEARMKGGGFFRRSTESDGEDPSLPSI